MMIASVSAGESSHIITGLQRNTLYEIRLFCVSHGSQLFGSNWTEASTRTGKVLWIMIRQLARSPVPFPYLSVTQLKFCLKMSFLTKKFFFWGGGEFVNLINKSLDTDNFHIIGQLHVIIHADSL